MGRVLGPQAHTTAPEEQGQRGLDARPMDGRPEERKRPTGDAPHNGERSPRPGTTSHHHRGARPPAGHARERHSAGRPRPHTRAHSTWAADANCPPAGQAAGERQAADLKPPS